MSEPSCAPRPPAQNVKRVRRRTNPPRLLSDIIVLLHHFSAAGVPGIVIRVSVIAIFIGAEIDAIENTSQQPRSRLTKHPATALHNMPGCTSGTHDQKNSVHLGRDDLHIGYRCDRWRVENDELVLRTHLREQIAKL